MKWVSHQLITTTAVLAITNNPTMAILAGSMSPLPDKVDHLCGVFGRMPIKMFNHREYSHYWGFWMLIAVFAYMYMIDNQIFFTSYSQYADVLTRLAVTMDYHWFTELLFPNLMFWASVGSLFHIFEDFFSGMGVPLVFPSKLSPHIKLYKTGSFREYLLVAVLSGLFFWIYLQNNPSIDFLIRQMFVCLFNSATILASTAIGMW